MNRTNSLFWAKPSGNPVFIVERFRKAKFLGLVAFLSLFYQLVFPTVSWALTSGPSSPEFSSFEPVATTNMVNDFTGQFGYNIPVIDIPGANGGGYSMSLSYHSGENPESESSWVGYGWTLNPGSISHNRRGIPDDYNGNEVTYHNNVPKNWTFSVSPAGGFQAFSILSVGITSTGSYNNYRGYRVYHDIGLSLARGIITMNPHYERGYQTKYEPKFNPGAILTFAAAEFVKSDALNGFSESKLGQTGLLQSVGSAMVSRTAAYINAQVHRGTSEYVSYLNTNATSPYNLTPYTGKNTSGYGQGSADPFPVPIGVNAGIGFGYNWQKNVGQRDVASYGYMYSGHAQNNNSGDEECMMDYTLENAGTFSIRDKFLPIPFSTPDAYFVSGEGLSGGFRMYNDRIGIYSPNFVQSTIDMNYIGIDVHVGLDFGVGGEYIKEGENKLRVRSSWTSDGYDFETNGNNHKYWSMPTNYQDLDHVISERVALRFNNDLGGKLVYDNSDKPVAATINGENPNLPESFQQIRGDHTVPGGRRSARATYIGYRTNGELMYKNANNKRVYAYENRDDIHSLAGRDLPENANLRNLVGEVSIVNEGGDRYNYGLPVYTAHEKNIQNGLSSITASHNFLASGSIANNAWKIGEEYKAPYVSSYLLTTITTPDYIDQNLNGADDADYGGYTKFTYKLRTGSVKKNSTSSMYHWRVPYQGVYYNPSRLSDNRDNMGNYQSGYKEVYQLDSIVTKTHYAVFMTSERYDGRDAANDDDAAEATGGSSTAIGPNKSYKLDKVCIYAKSTKPGEPDKLIKTVHFEYDYAAWSRVSNSWNGGSISSKLTLKKVWFEYNGTVNAFINPYIFEYQYPTSVTYPSQYQGIQTEMSAFSVADQNPGYPTGKYVDAWGNYQYDGNNRRNNFLAGPGQTPPSNFDPAAWQLKRIILPSGGEIHVQYEQHTYSNVQNRQASALVNLDKTPAPMIANGNTYLFDASQLGYSASEVPELVDLINQTYFGEKIFYKFLYTLKGVNVADLNSCNAEFMEGYVQFSTCSQVSGTTVKITVTGELPKKHCQDWVDFEIGRNVLDGNCSPVNSVTDPDGLSDPMAAASLSWVLIGKIWQDIFGGGPSYCMQAKPEHSYLRIPIHKKRGGGVRVKRLMMYNPGVDASDPTLYGTEYIYENSKEGTSYGVATNEPPENSAENPLFESLEKRVGTPHFNEVLAGNAKNSMEGPLGKNVLPGASIGYSKIIKKNIHQALKTGTGFTVTEYFTAKDFPYDGYYPAAGANGSDFTPIQTVRTKPEEHTGLFTYKVKHFVKSSQGYSFLQNDMHGQIKSSTDYPGVFDPDKFFAGINVPAPVGQTAYEYFKPGEAVPMFDANSWGVYYDHPGKEMDITIDRRSVLDKTDEVRHTGDLTAGYILAVLIPYPIGFPVSSHYRNVLNTISISKVVHYPTILKSMTVMKDGYYQTTNNIAFDPLTCKPVVTRTYDGHHGLSLAGAPAHDGTYTTYNFLASSQYGEMRQKAFNERYIYEDTAITVNSVGGGYYSIPFVNTTGVFAPGDLVGIHHSSGIYMANVMEINGSGIKVLPAQRYNNSIPTSTGTTKVEVINSGYTNQLASSMKGITEYGKTDLPQSPQVLLNYLADLCNDCLNSANDTDSVIVDITSYGNVISLNTVSQNFYNCGCPVDTFKFYKSGYLGGLACIGCYPGVAQGMMIWSSSACPGSPVPGLGPSSFYWQGFGIHSGSYVTMTYAPASGWWGLTQLAGLPLYTLIVDDNSEGTESQGRNQICMPDITKRVIRAEYMSYCDTGAYDPLYGIPGYLNPYERGELGKWRPKETYVYRDSTKPGTRLNIGERNYNNAGTFPFKIYPWLPTIYNVDSPKWVRLSQITNYSPNGNATEEFDAEQVYSASKYGYYFMLPYLVAQNAKYNSVHFESFENVYGGASGFKVEEGMLVNNSLVIKTPHTGRFGYRMYNYLPDNHLNIPTTTDPDGKDIIVKLWAKVNSNAANWTLFKLSATGFPSQNFTTIARSGEWALLSARWPNATPGASFNFKIEYVGEDPTIVIDDIRVQPKESVMSAYVYDTRNYKVSAVMDDMHFALFYEYNGEGKLVRKSKETIKGIKTVEETQYHLPEFTRQ